MEISAQNADGIVLKLFAWRNKAAAAGRDEDADMLGAVMGFIRETYPIGSTAQVTTKRGFVPVGTPVTAASAEVCPYNLDGCCPNCEIDKFQLFIVPGVPGRAYACFSMWVQANDGRDKTFVAK